MNYVIKDPRQVGNRGLSDSKIRVPDSFRDQGLDLHMMLVVYRPLQYPCPKP